MNRCTVQIFILLCTMCGVVVCSVTVFICSIGCIDKAIAGACKIVSILSCSIACGQMMHNFALHSSGTFLTLTVLKFKGILHTVSAFLLLSSLPSILFLHSSNSLSYHPCTP